MNQSVSLRKPHPVAPILVFLAVMLPLGYGACRRVGEVRKKTGVQQTQEELKAAEARQAKAEEAIFQAAAKSDVVAVKALLATPDGTCALLDPRDYWYEQVAFRRESLAMMKTFWICHLPPKKDELSFALNRIIRKGNEATAFWLLERGARYRQTSEESDFFQVFPSERLFAALLDAGADPNAVRTLTHLRGSRHEIAYKNAYGFTLKKQGYDETEEKGYTLLMEATAKKKLAIVKMLLAHGANVNAKTGLGTTALRIAKKENWMAGVLTLKTAGAK